MRQFAPAKVNLALHVTGRRDDGYHLLDSLVVFAAVGDWIDIRPSDALTLSVSGPRAAGVPTDSSNLVWRSAQAFGESRGATIHLEKHLPHAGGIGGGSADAGATLRGLAALWGQDMPDGDTLLAIGADIPVCAASDPARMRGIGDSLDPVPTIPPIWLVLVNPGVETPTGPVFKALESTDNTPMPTPEWSEAEELLTWLVQTRNDLEGPAKSLVPEVSHVLDTLSESKGCQLARMSGSGATCFGVFFEEKSALAAAKSIKQRRGSWWVEAANVLTQAP